MGQLTISLVIYEIVKFVISILCKYVISQSIGEQMV
jgi:hypothetical protein